MEKTKPVLGTVMSTLPDADDFDLLSGAHKSMKDGSRHCAVPPVKEWLYNSYRADTGFVFSISFLILAPKIFQIFKLNFILPLFHVI
jgi:hypothetical protein